MTNQPDFSRRREFSVDHNTFAQKPDFFFCNNIGNPGEITVLDTAKKIKELMNYDGEIVFEGLPSDDPMRRMPDITLAKKTLGWEPKVSVDEGLIKTIEYFRGMV